MEIIKTSLHELELKYRDAELDFLKKEKRVLQLKLELATKCFNNVAGTLHSVMKIVDNTHSDISFKECTHEVCISNTKILNTISE